MDWLRYVPYEERPVVLKIFKVVLQGYLEQNPFGKAIEEVIYREMKKHLSSHESKIEQFLKEERQFYTFCDLEVPS